MEEFTYLEPSRWNGTSRTERLPHIEAYWQTADPSYRDGPRAESFDTLLGRVETTLARLEKLPADALVYAFSHGQFMQAVRVFVAELGLDLAAAHGALPGLSIPVSDSQCRPARSKVCQRVLDHDSDGDIRGRLARAAAACRERWLIEGQSDCAWHPRGLLLKGGASHEKLRWDLDESQSLSPGWPSMLRDVIAEVQREG